LEKRRPRSPHPEASDSRVHEAAIVRRGDVAPSVQVCGEAANGKEALEKAPELHPDLIVLDLSMPVMNSLDAARVLKQQMPAVPLIMFSEYSNAFSEQEARSAGISALVSKSEHVSVVVEKARSLLYDIAA
jgi:DNA-binding NarL/FixJ family response regulator